jgi:hypothetical protein
MEPMFSGADYERYYVLFTAMELLAALAILVVSRLRLGMPEEAASPN